MWPSLSIMSNRGCGNPVAAVTADLETVANVSINALVERVLMEAMVLWEKETNAKRKRLEEAQAPGWRHYCALRDADREEVMAFLLSARRALAASRAEAAMLDARADAMEGGRK